MECDPRPSLPSIYKLFGLSPQDSLDSLKPSSSASYPSFSSIAHNGSTPTPSAPPRTSSLKRHPSADSLSEYADCKSPDDPCRFPQQHQPPSRHSLVPHHSNNHPRSRASSYSSSVDSSLTHLRSPYAHPSSSISSFTLENSSRSRGLAHHSDDQFPAIEENQPSSYHSYSSNYATYPPLPQQQPHVAQADHYHQPHHHQYHRHRPSSYSSSISSYRHSQPSRQSPSQYSATTENVSSNNNNQSSSPPPGGSGFSAWSRQPIRPHSRSSLRSPPSEANAPFTSSSNTNNNTSHISRTSSTSSNHASPKLSSHPYPNSINISTNGVSAGSPPKPITLSPKSSYSSISSLPHQSTSPPLSALSPHSNSLATSLSNALPNSVQQLSPPSSASAAGSGNHICPICSKRFIRPSARDTHLHSHTGEKPYACDVCGRRFSVHSNLKRHAKVHLGRSSSGSTNSAVTTQQAYGYSSTNANRSTTISVGSTSPAVAHLNHRQPSPFYSSSYTKYETESDLIKCENETDAVSSEHEDEMVVDESREEAEAVSLLALAAAERLGVSLTSKSPAHERSESPSSYRHNTPALSKVHPSHDHYSAHPVKEGGHRNSNEVSTVQAWQTSSERDIPLHSSPNVHNKSSSNWESSVTHPSSSRNKHVNSSFKRNAPAKYFKLQAHADGRF